MVVRLLYNLNQTCNSSLDRDSFMEMVTFFHLIDKMQQLLMINSCPCCSVARQSWPSIVSIFYLYDLLFFCGKTFKNSNRVHSTRFWNNHHLVMNIAEILLIWHFTTNNRSASILNRTLYQVLSWPINIISYLVKEY